ncbi:hypothetical protein Tco_1530752 [Tanacetum coccineum]
MYSTSVLDMVVLFCFLDDQLTNLSPKSCILPDVLLLDQQHLWRTFRRVKTMIANHTKPVEPALTRKELSSTCTHGWDYLDLQARLGLIDMALT